MNISTWRAQERSQPWKTWTAKSACGFDGLSEVIGRLDWIDDPRFRTTAARFETAEELLLALERAAARPLAPPRPVPLRGGGSRRYSRSRLT